MSLQPFEISLLLAVGLLAVELITGSFVVVCFSPALLLVALVEYIWQDFDLLRDLLVFLLALLLATLTVRRLFKKPGDSQSTGKDINDY